MKMGNDWHAFLHVYTRMYTQVHTRLAAGYRRFMRSAARGEIQGSLAPHSRSKGTSRRLRSCVVLCVSWGGERGGVDTCWTGC